MQPFERSKNPIQVNLFGEQEPHTKMWGKTRVSTVSTKTFSLKPNFNLDSSASGLRFARSAVHDMSEWGP
jgi:hypothetical protein